MGVWPYERDLARAQNDHELIFTTASKRSVDVPRAAVAPAADGLKMTWVDDRRAAGLSAFRCRPKRVDGVLKTDLESGSPAD
jgi:hypothetical protein